jgi:catechol 2,3-dioxygenase-like lactoylglutathione lyase family enzyme
LLDHVVIAVSDHQKSRAFYGAALASLGIEISGEWKTSFALGYPSEEPQLGFRAAPAPVTAQHIAIRAPSERAVQQFYEAALAVGGIDNGAPGYRPHYGAGYYAAFVIDPDGHNIEAVFHAAGADQTS